MQPVILSINQTSPNPPSPVPGGDIKLGSWFTSSENTECGNLVYSLTTDTNGTPYTGNQVHIETLDNSHLYYDTKTSTNLTLYVKCSFFGPFTTAVYQLVNYTV